MDAREIKFLNAFNAIPGVGPVTLRALQDNFGSFETAWQSGDGELENAPLDPQARSAILEHRSRLHPDKEMERLVKERIWILTEEDPLYPSLLKEIHNPPVIIYGRGNPRLLAEEKLRIAIVGTRKPSQYGVEATRKIASELVEQSIIIVSGLATGIDTEAHQAALNAKGNTIAVLGSGLDPISIFPPENVRLASRIEEVGSIVMSEYAPGTPAMKENFPLRNRIISGLSNGVVVVEARERSGALITARLALEQNRDVFAVPGSIFTSTAVGPLSLLQQGAKPVTSARDILAEFGIDIAQKQEHYRHSWNENEKAILEILEDPLDVDALKQRTKFATGTLIATLSTLELKGVIKNMGNDVYQKIISGHPTS